MVAVIERDRRLARRLQAALEARGCRVRVAHGYHQALALFARHVPQAIYISETLQRLSGGDLLVVADGDGRLARVPTLVRVSRDDSVFARTIRRGGIYTAETPLDVERTATLLMQMADGNEGTLRALVTEARELHLRTRRTLSRVGETVQRTLTLRERLGRKG